jgi:hypothetical protein
MLADQPHRRNPPEEAPPGQFRSRAQDQHPGGLQKAGPSRVSGGVPAASPPVPWTPARRVMTGPTNEATTCKEKR